MSAGPGWRARCRPGWAWLLANGTSCRHQIHDGAGRLIAIDKRVYGDIEMQHRYDHDAEGRLCQATVTLGEDEPVVRTF